MNLLDDNDFLRYQRQITIPKIGEEGQHLLMSSRVLMIGCGGLGSVVAPYLVGAGLGSLVIVDDDCVTISNLHRQLVYRSSDLGQNKAIAMKSQLQNINHNVDVRAIDYRLKDEQLNLEVMMVDIVVDCSDNFVTRQLINQICFRHKKKLVSGAAIGLEGQFATYDYLDNSPCYRCIYPAELDHTTTCSSLGVLGPVVGLIGSLQALGVIKELIPDLSESNKTHRQLSVFDGKTLTLKNYAIQRDPDCPVCGKEGVSCES